MVTVFLRQKIAQKDFWEKIRLKLFGGILKTGLSQPALNQIKKFQRFELALKFSIDWHGHCIFKTKDRPKRRLREHPPKAIWRNP